MAPDQPDDKTPHDLPQLFHAISDEGSAEARRLVVELGLGERVRFRNLTYPEVEADFRAHGGTRPPALWDGHALLEGAEAVTSALRRLHHGT